MTNQPDSIEEQPEAPEETVTRASVMSGICRSFFGSVEGRIFIAGCLMLLLWIGVLVALFHRGDSIWSQTLSMGFAHLVAGRAASIAHATQVGMNPVLIVVIAVYHDVMIMFMIYPVLVFSYKNFLEKRFFRQHMQPMFDTARRKMSTMRRFEILGIFLFVWFPFWMTGIIVGALLGFLMGLRTWVTMTTVILGTTAAVACWVFAYDKLYDLVGRVHQGVPLALTILIISVLVIARIVSLARQPTSAPEPPGKVGEDHEEG